MSTQPTLTSVQLAALDLIIASHEEKGSNANFSFITGIGITDIIQGVVKTAQILTQVVGAAAHADSNVKGLAAEELGKLQNVSLEQLKKLRSQVAGK